MIQRYFEKLKLILGDKNIQKLMRESWSFSWPLVMVMFFEFFVSLTDVFIAGKLGKEVQASVGFVTQFYFIFMVIVHALTSGTVALTARLFSSGDEKKFCSAVYTVFTTSVCAGLILAAAGFIGGPLVISVLKIPPEIKVYAVPLVKIYMCGLPFHYLLANTNGVLRASKKVRHSMMTMFGVSVCNIALNFTLVFYTPLGFYGIAISTAASMVFGSLLNTVFLKQALFTCREFSHDVFKKIVSLGWPTGLLQVAWQVGSMVMFLILGMLPSNTVEIMAAFTNGMRIESVIFLPAYALNMAAAALAGNLLGEGKKDDAYASGIITGLSGVVLITILTAAVMLNARWIAGILSDNPLVINESVRYIMISMISEPFMAWAVIMGGALNGAGDTKGVMWIVSLSVWAVRIPLSYFGAVYFGFGVVAVWWAMNISILVRTLWITKRFTKRSWMKL